MKENMWMRKKRTGVLGLVPRNIMEIRPSGTGVSKAIAIRAKHRAISNGLGNML